MKIFRWAIVLAAAVLISGCASMGKLEKESGMPRVWRAVHLLDDNNNIPLEELGMTVPRLAGLGINVIVLEVDYNFEFQSHTELRRGAHPVTKKEARALAKICRKNGIRLIPEFQCLGHQSWEKETFPLLVRYPQFDLTPGAFPGNKDIYCREWDLLNPQVYTIVFQLMDEIIDAFQADAFHVGMDEVFLLGSDKSPSTRGKDPGELYAKAVNDLYCHLVEKRGLEMLMWGDRLFDGRNLDFGEWESSLNGTAGAVDKIPKDIIICPWHYEKKDAYPSIPLFMEKGFRVLPSSWRQADAAKALLRYSLAQENLKMLGHMFTTWSVTKLLEYPPLLECLPLIREK